MINQNFGSNSKVTYTFVISDFLGTGVVHCGSTFNYIKITAHVGKTIDVWSEILVLSSIFPSIPTISDYGSDCVRKMNLSLS